jgi:hypothetical protein
VHLGLAAGAVLSTQEFEARARVEAKGDTRLPCSFFMQGRIRLPRMKRSMFEARFYETYYYASAIRNILNHQFDYIRALDDFYGDDRYLGFVSPFPKRSALHWFIEFVVDRMIGEEAAEVDLEKRQDLVRRFQSMPTALASLRPAVLPINEALIEHGIAHSSFEEWLAVAGKSFLDALQEDVEEYYDDLQSEQWEAYDALLERVVDETFFVLFQNRGLLLLFNEIIASQVREAKPELLGEEHRLCFASPGVLKRVDVPSWVKRAVFFRDRGLCSLCQSDQSGVLNLGGAEHYDHVVPLARGGLNDVSNIQLLCGACNLKKRDGVALTSNRYEAWYPNDSE